ncbi:MAG: EF-hand domain-containing protein [Candidatus Polarisedimenticolaceae bacterium]|nr:EF-hand domain-containing protein [Candidatus Polarisedimenticolaceae bacterium]
MNRLKISMALILMAGVAVTAPLVAAESESVPTRGPTPFATYDIDNNQSISEQEFYQIRSQRMGLRATEGRLMRRAAEAPSFAQFDSNGDGQLSRQELMAGQQSQMQNRRGRMGMGGAPGMGRSMRGNMPTFPEFDLNGDGLLTEEELYKARNQRIGERAKQGYLMKGLGSAPSFAEMDGDGNGRLTPEEFSAAQAKHRQDRRQQ